MSASRWLAIPAVALALCASGRVASASPAAPEGESAQRGAPSTTVPGVGFTLLTGLALPICSGQPGSCAGGLDVGPSLQAAVLFQPLESWAFGIVGQLSRTHWHDDFVSQLDGAPHPLDADLTNGFVGVAARIVPLPRRIVSPIIQLALASAFQIEPSSSVGCDNGGLTPTGQAALGARARVSSSFALVAMASATAGVKLSGSCGLSDGPPPTPFAGWGWGLHVGASFDVGLGGGAAASLAAR